MSTTIICKTCGKEKLIKNSEVKENNYCSMSCFSISQSSRANHGKKILTETQKAYIAGFMDGEGTITISKARNKAKTAHIKEFNLRPFIILGNSNKEVVEWLCDTTGLGMIYGGGKPFKKHWSVIWRWQVTSNQARELLNDILPYLIVKKEEAELALSLPIMISRKFDQSIYNKQMEILSKMRDINDRAKPEKTQR